MPCARGLAHDGLLGVASSWQRMEGSILQLVGERRADQIKLVLAKDGSGVGAAIIAAISR